MSTLAVCIDCAMRGANGYEPDMTDYATGHRHRYEAAMAVNDGAEPIPTRPDVMGLGDVVLTDIGAHFSWRPCEYCGDINGGDRIPSQLGRGIK
jgi:hypothetical protein